MGSLSADQWSPPRRRRYGASCFPSNLLSSCRGLCTCALVATWQRCLIHERVTHPNELEKYQCLGLWILRNRATPPHRFTLRDWHSDDALIGDKPLFFTRYMMVSPGPQLSGNFWLGLKSAEVRLGNSRCMLISCNGLGPRLFYLAFFAMTVPATLLVRTKQSVSVHSS